MSSHDRSYVFQSINYYIDLQTADKVFEMLLGDRQHIPQIREFLRDQKTYKNISKDQWMSIYDFSMQVGPKFDGYDPDDGTCMFKISINLTFFIHILFT